MYSQCIGTYLLVTFTELLLPNTESQTSPLFLLQKGARRLLRPLKEIRTMAFRLTECCANFLSDNVPIFLDGGC